MDAAVFVAKRRGSTRSERAASHEHFLELCELVEHPKPGDGDPHGIFFANERRVQKSGADGGSPMPLNAITSVGSTKGSENLDDAYNQLLQYCGNLGNPPLLIVSEVDLLNWTTRDVYPFTGRW